MNIYKHIKNIYDTISVYKAFFVIIDECLHDKLFHILRNENFPIGRFNSLHDIHKFNHNLKRILLLDKIDLKNIDFLSKEYGIDLNEINLIIFVINNEIFTDDDVYIDKNIFSLDTNIIFI